ncbi:hypothetical protein ACJ5W3_001235 [Enterobacter hormaechei]|nr:hypothetical protein [Enterobacter hormaechei]
MLLRSNFLSCLHGSELVYVLREAWLSFLSCLHGSELHARQRNTIDQISKLPARQ